MSNWMSGNNDAFIEKDSFTEVARGVKNSSSFEMESSLSTYCPKVSPKRIELGQSSNTITPIENLVSLHQLPSNSKEHVVRLKVVLKIEATQNPEEGKIPMYHHGGSMGSQGSSYIFLR